MKRLKINLVVTNKQIFPPVRFVYPHLGLCYLSAYLKKYLPKKMEINYVGFHPLEFGILKKIMRNSPDIIGFACDTATFNLISDIAQKIKGISHIPLILGGAHITSMPQTLPPYIDIGVVGEGEQTFLELIKVLMDNKKFNPGELEKIRGICFHKDDQVYITDYREEIEDIDSIPHPDRKILNLEKVLNSPYLFYPVEKEFGTSMITSRGCPYHCVFCQTRLRWRTVRYNSAQYIVEEIELLRKLYPKMNLIRIVDDLFLVNKLRLEQVVDLIKKKSLEKGVFFCINAKADVINEETLKLLKLMNVIEVGFGFESASKRVLGFLKNNTVTSEDNQNACRLTNKYGIRVNGQFIFGTPGETRQDIEETVDFIKRNKFSNINTAVATPLPGTRLWQMAREQGFFNDVGSIDWNKFSIAYDSSGSYTYFNKGMPESEFLDIMEKIKKLRNEINRPIHLYHHNIYGLALRFIHKFKIMQKYLNRKFLENR